MKHRASVLFILLVGSALTTSAQQKRSDLSGKNILPDTMLVNNEVQWQDLIANMPIYNPKGTDAKILVMESLGKWIYNMPVIGGEKRANLSDSLSKNWYKKWPGKIDKNQKDKPAEKEQIFWVNPSRFLVVKFSDKATNKSTESESENEVRHGFMVKSCHSERIPTAAGRSRRISLNVQLLYLRISL